MSRPATATAVSAAFDQAAPRYDLMVALNPGYHRHLRTAADALTATLPRDRPWRLLDLGCGSGASTRALLRSAAAGPGVRSLVGVDGSVGMLSVAASKDWPTGVRFERRLAEDIDRDLVPDPDALDGVLACYLFRNVTDRDAALAATLALLRPGGTLVVQDYSVAGRPLAQLVWTLVCWLVVIPLSRLLDSDTWLYRYLWRSVLGFDSVAEFMARLQAAGFVDVESRTVAGWQRGILHIVRGRRPSAS